MKKELSLRKIDCPKYADCLGVAAHAEGNFSCRGCEKFSKWPYGKKIETIKPTVAPETRGKEAVKMPEKTCSKCGQPKSLDEFTKNASTPDGLEYKCRKCLADYRAARKKSSREDGGKGNGRRKCTARSIRSNPSVSTAAIQGIYLDPAVIKAIQKSAAKQILKEFSEFLEERYS